MVSKSAGLKNKPIFDLDSTRLEGMTKAGLLSLIVLVAAAFGTAAPANPEVRLWAAVGVVKPLFRVHDMSKMSVDFVVVNDGQTTANPDIGASHLFINGVEPKDWLFVINNGPRTSYFTALPLGETLSFGYELGPHYFAAPGIYAVRWEGANFRSALVTFRVVK